MTGPPGGQYNQQQYQQYYPYMQQQQQQVRIVQALRYFICIQFQCHDIILLTGIINLIIFKLVI
jgi:hypothetical protein